MNARDGGLCLGCWMAPTMGTGFRLPRERSKEGSIVVQGSRYGLYTSYRAFWAHSSCAMPCDGAHQNGKLWWGASSGSRALLQLSCWFCPVRVLFQPSFPWVMWPSPSCIWPLILPLGSPDSLGIWFSQTQISLLSALLRFDSTFVFHI